VHLIQLKKGKAMTKTFTNDVSTNANSDKLEECVTHEDSYGEHVFKVWGVQFDDEDDKDVFEKMLNTANLGQGRFYVEHNSSSRNLEIRYLFNSMYDEANNDFAYDIVEKLNAIFN
jgi:hypothetical protein